MLSVIVVNWNGKHLLGDCLSSLRTQTLRNIETTLVDNGSTDNSADYVRQAFPEVQILALDTNTGFAAANNRAIEACSSEFVALLNNDAVADSHWAENLLAGVVDARAGLGASKVMLAADPNLLDSAGDCMTTVGVAYKRGHREPGSLYATRCEVFGASGCAMLLRRAMLDDVGLFDEDFFLLYEDGDLGFRARLKGWKAVFVPEAVVYHKLNASIGKLSRTHVYYGQRNMEYLFFKNMPGGLLWKYLPAHLLNDFLACLYFTWRGQAAGYFRSKADFLRGLRSVLNKRRAIQSQRTLSAAEFDHLLDKKWLRSRLAGK